HHDFYHTAYSLTGWNLTFQKNGYLALMLLCARKTGKMFCFTTIITQNTRDKLFSFQKIYLWWNLILRSGIYFFKSPFFLAVFFVFYLGPF
ncbi:MAG: hypothetical protein J6I64_05680, partial [Lachnospiraceae bacterium]|nr:hypothetical protein [Lachnospiraceae bacterium]